MNKHDLNIIYDLCTYILNNVDKENILYKKAMFIQNKIRCYYE